MLFFLLFFTVNSQLWSFSFQAREFKNTHANPRIRQKYRENSECENTKNNARKTKCDIYNYSETELKTLIAHGINYSHAYFC